MYMAEGKEIRPAKRGLTGKIRVPGDKSVSHRSVMFSAIAKGKVHVRNFLEAADCLSTAACMRALGAGVVSGTVREVAPMADAVSRTYRVRVSVPAPPAGMALGMTANVAVGRARTLAVRLPLAAIYQTGGTPSVWLVGADNKVFLQEVAVDGYDGNDVLVRGLPDGALVVTAGVHKLREGDEVRTGDAP